MRRTLSLIFWALVALVLVTVGLANREMVTLSVLPAPLAQAIGRAPNIELPLFMGVFLGFALGMLLGFVWEWIREIPERAAARDTSRELARLRTEVARLSGTPGDGRDEVDLLLGVPAVPRAALPARR